MRTSMLRMDSTFFQPRPWHTNQPTSYKLLHTVLRINLAVPRHSYTVLENRTAVDLELTAMRKDNVLRTFRLGTGREDWGIMSTAHYLRVVSAISPCSVGR